MHGSHLSDKDLEQHFPVGFLWRCWSGPPQPASRQGQRVLSLLPPPAPAQCPERTIPTGTCRGHFVLHRDLPTTPCPATKLMGIEVRWLCVGCELRQGSLTSHPGACPAAQALETAQRGESDSEAHPASPQVGRPTSDSPQVPLAPVSQCSGRAGAGHRTPSPRPGPEKGHPHDLPSAGGGVLGRGSGMVRQGRDSRDPGAGVGFKHKVLR